MNARTAAARLAASAADRWRRRLAAGACDATDALAGRSLMVLAPHPDDETFGCGALIARARAAGSTVTVVIATDGSRCTSSARLGPAEIVALRRAGAAGGGGPPRGRRGRHHRAGVRRRHARRRPGRVGRSPDRPR